MARINVDLIEEDGFRRTAVGWFDPAKSDHYEEATRWDGNNTVGVSSGIDIRFANDTLYRTPGGRWVLNRDRSSYYNGRDSFVFVTDDVARQWLISQDGEHDAAVERWFGALAEESGPIGRPSMGDAPAISVKIPAEMLATIDSLADGSGVARAEWIRRACESAIEGQTWLAGFAEGDDLIVIQHSGEDIDLISIPGEGTVSALIRYEPVDGESWEPEVYDAALAEAGWQRVGDWLSNCTEMRVRRTVR